MKKVLSIIAITSVVALVMTSCSGNKTKDAANTVSYEDTVGLSKFQEWKMMNERADVAEYNQQQAASIPAKKTVAKTNSTSKSGTMSSETTNQAKAKKGWSKSAKYAVIGGVVGGTTGAVINKKDRVKGAIIGVVLGAGTGYGIGRSQDKKDGRL